MFFFKKRHQPRKRKFNASYAFMMLLVLILLLSPALYFVFNTNQAEAVWFDDTYGYRQVFTFTHNATISAERAITVTFDNAEMIAASVMQADCDDVRFTDVNGKLLPHDLTSSCNNASATYEVIFPSIINGTNVGYIYYGNPSAVTAEIDSTAFTALTPNSGDPSAITTRTNEQFTPGPVAYWKFDEGVDNTCKNGTDDVCNSSPGTYDMDKVNDTAWQTSDQCISGQCLYFDGANDHVLRSENDPLLNFVAANSFSVSVWVKISSTYTGNDTILSTMDADGTDGGYRMRFSSEDFSFSIDDDDADTTTEVIETTSGIYNDNRWHHLLAVKDGTTGMYLYVDGLLVVSNTSLTETGTLVNNDGIVLGTDMDGVSNDFVGFIDDVKVYRYAKTANQVKTDFASRGSLHGSSAILGTGTNATNFLNQGLVGYWPMDEFVGNTCTGGANDNCDKSGNGNDALWANNTAVGTGKFGNGTTYDGTDDESAVADNDLYSISTTNKLTVSGWINFTALASTTDPISKALGSNYEWAVRADSSGAPHARIFDSAGGDFMNCNGATSSITTGSWFHYTMTADLTNTSLKLFINGVQVCEDTSSSGSYTNGTGKLQFGTRDDGAQDLNGLIDEVRIYNRALSPVEVSQLYNWAPGPQIYLPFDDNTGTTTTAEKSGNARVTTLVGVSASSWVPGKFGSALDFDGTTTYVTVDTPGLSNTNYTYMAWVKLDAFSTAADSYVFVVPSVSATDGIRLRVRDSTGPSNDFELLNATTGQVINGDDNAVIVNRWTHIAVTREGTVNKMYIDGVFATLGNVESADLGLTTNACDLIVGNDADTGCTGSFGGFDAGEWWDGPIDEFRVYNYSRTADQIREDMNGGHVSPGGVLATQIAHWKLDELAGTTANNSTQDTSNIKGIAAYTYTSTITGALWTSGSSCKINGCLNFDGTDDVLTITDSRVHGTDAGLVSGLTYSAWVNPDTVGEGSAGEIFRKSTTTFCRLGSTTPFNLSCSLDLGTDATLTVNAVVPASTWTHVAMTWTDDADDEITIWINGVNRGSSTNGVGPPSAETSSLLIGGGTSNNWDGKIDEFKIYSGELSPQELLVDMNANASVNFGSTSVESAQLTDGSGNAPVGYWPLDENTGTSTTVDKSGNARNGTLSGLTEDDWMTAKKRQWHRF